MMEAGLPLFDHDQRSRNAGRLRSERGIARATEAQEFDAPGFTDRALSALKKLATEQDHVHIDDFLRAFKEQPEHPNMMGGVWRKARNQGWIEPTGFARPCTVDDKKNGHCYPVYRSLLRSAAA